MISVCMAVFNGSEYIRSQLLTVLNQLSDEDEVIIVNDCSNDNSREIISKMRDKRIKIIDNLSNQGVIKSFEKSIQKSRGDYIFLCDQDDLWMPDKVAVMIRMLREEGIDLVISDAYILEFDTIMLDTFYFIRKSHPGFIKNVIKNSFIGCCMAFKSDLKPKILPFPESIPMHDQWIGLRAEVTGQVRFIPDCLTIYRRHSNNVTQLKSLNFLSILSKRVALIKAFCEYYLDGRST